PDRAQQTDCFGQRKLFAAHAGNEITAANLPARFPAPINPAELIPAYPETFALEQTTEDDAITTQEHARGFFDRVFPLDLAVLDTVLLGVPLRPQQRPAPGELDARKIGFAPAFPF